VATRCSTAGPNRHAHLGVLQLVRVSLRFSQAGAE